MKVEAFRRFASLAAPWILLFGTTLAVVVLYDRVKEAESLTLTWKPWAALLLVMSASTAVLAANVLWRCLVHSAAGADPGMAGAIRGFGWLMIGKYLPGKLAGLIGRAAVLPESVPAQTRIGLVVAEQGLAFWGLSVVSVLSLMLHTEGLKPLVKVVLLILVLVSPWLARRIWGAMRELIPRLGSRPLVWPTGRLPWFLALILGFSVVFPAAVIADFAGITVEVSDRVIIFGAYGLAIIVGMVAFVLPAGIGAREASFVFLVGGVLGGDEAIVLALLLRLWAVLFDLLGGLAAVGITFASSRKSSIGSL